MSVAIDVQICDGDFEIAMGTAAGGRLACVNIPIVAQLNIAIVKVYSVA